MWSLFLATECRVTPPEMDERWTMHSILDALDVLEAQADARPKPGEK